ncbi:uncharacterized protein [Dermacentor andersoni]|uniref:uncharacterized protein isoform X4 n=1 Tax=Dermacentor andersoni TaxID=34620 RepID=UPI0024167809|nr:uncharacterized protein LOC126544568 isoform X4 [Dermacentor andersoni]
MRKDIQYRDLPGGPLMVKFADELPLCSLCSKCGMLSKDMFEDPSSHAFCSICIFECSDRKKIHCKYENKDVSVEEMMPAIDIINVVMDQVVFCPNTSDGNSCTKYCTLKDLEGHYLECEKTKIICLSCGDTVKGRDWQTHVTSCPQQIMQCRYCVVAVPRFRLELHERLCSYNPNAVREADTSPMAAMDFTSRRRSDWARNEKQLPVSVNTNKPHLIPEAKPSDISKVDDDTILSCRKCNRNVKSKNMDKHIRVCLQRTNGPSSPEARQTPEIAPVLPTRGAAAIRAPAQEYLQHKTQERVLPALPILLPTLDGHPNEHALPTREHVAARASMQPDFNFQRQMFAQPASPIPHIAPGERWPAILGDYNGVRQGGGNIQMATHDNLENKPSQSEATTTEVAVVASDMGSLLSSYEMLSLSDVPTADDITEHGHYPGPRQGGEGSQMAAGDIVGTQPSQSEQTSGHYSGVRQESGYSQMAASNIVQTQPSRSEEAPDDHRRSSSRKSNPSSQSLQPPIGKWPQQLQQGDWGGSKTTNCSGKSRSEVAAVASDMGSLQSSYEMLSLSDVPADDDITKHGHYLGARQGGEGSQMAAGYIVGRQPSRSEETSGHYSGFRQEGGYSQMAASNIVQTQPSRSEEAPTEAPGPWSNILNYVGLGRYLGTRPVGGCSETATDDVAGTQSSRSEETSGQCGEVGQEAGCSQMAASESVQTQPSRSEETPTEAPGPWSNILNYVGLGRYLGTRQVGGCSETATDDVAGTQSSRSEETSGHCVEVGQEAGYSQMAASESVQTQPSRSEETPGDHHWMSSRKSNPSSQSLQPPIGKWPQQLQQGDWGRSKTTYYTGKAPSVRKTPHRSRNSKDKSQQTLRWRKQQCFEKIDYYADVSSYYDEHKGTDADNDYNDIEHNRFAGPGQRDGHDESSVVDRFVQANTTLQTLKL